jgi:hypothetical protein
MQGMSLLDAPVFRQEMLLAIAKNLKPMEANFGVSDTPTSTD